MVERVLSMHEAPGSIPGTSSSEWLILWGHHHVTGCSLSCRTLLGVDLWELCSHFGGKKSEIYLV